MLIQGENYLGRGKCYFCFRSTFIMFRLIIRWSSLCGLIMWKPALKELDPYDPYWYYIRAGSTFPPLFTFSHVFVCDQTWLYVVYWLPGFSRLQERWPSLFRETNIDVWDSFMGCYMARKIYSRGGLGVGAFRRICGGSKRNGSRPSDFGKSSGFLATLFSSCRK